MAQRGGRSFAEQVAGFVAKVERRSTAFVQSYGGQIVSELVQVSPVGMPDTWKVPPDPGYRPGHFRGNWQVSTGSPLTGERAGVDPDGGATISAALSALSVASAGDRVFIRNNLTYGGKLEYGYSRQAPQGMVRVTMAQTATMAQAAAAAARGVA